MTTDDWIYVTLPKSYSNTTYAAVLSQNTRSGKEWQRVLYITNKTVSTFQIGCYDSTNNETCAVICVGY